MGLLAFIILLPTVVFVHELGHFIFARITGVKVEAFSIGFGRALCTWTDKYGTNWKLSMIPLGGYVKMFGQSDLPETADKRAEYFKKLTKEEKKQNFEFKNRFQKSLIVGAGPAFNFLFGFLIFAMLFFFIGRPNFSPVISSVVDSSPAHTAGLLTGDKILFINDIKIEKTSDIAPLIENSKGEKLNIQILRDQLFMKIPVTPKQENGKYYLGIAHGEVIQGYDKEGFIKSISLASSQVSGIVSMTFKSLSEMLTGSRSSKELGGLLSIAKIGGEALSNGAYSFLYMIALISISLGLFNLFPIPVLDGGYLLIYLIESITRREISEKIKEKMFFIGFVFIVFLLLLANINDILRLFK